MRLRDSDLSTVYLKKREIDYDVEGNEVITYSQEATELRMNVQSAVGVVNAQVYGVRLPYIKACKYQGDLIKPKHNELDGICLDVTKDDTPDYQIAAIQPYSQHLNITLERIDGNVI